MTILRSGFELLRDTVAAFVADRASMYAAAIGYYTIFSAAPLLIFTVAVASPFLGPLALSGLVSRLRSVVGPEAAAFLREIAISFAGRAADRTFAIVGIVVLFVGAGTLFIQLKRALNAIWGVTLTRPQGTEAWLRRILSSAIPFFMVFVAGMLLIVSVIAESIVGVVNEWLALWLPATEQVELLNGLSVLPLLAFLTFSLIFKLLPDIQIRWRDVFAGSLFATVLFIIGNLVVGRFLEVTATTSVYGAAGALIVVLIWVYYSAQILFLGAEFTKVFARRYGVAERPSRIADYIRWPEPPLEEPAQPGDE